MYHACISCVVVSLLNDIYWCMCIVVVGCKCSKVNGIEEVEHPVLIGLLTEEPEGSP